MHAHTGPRAAGALLGAVVCLSAASVTGAQPAPSQPAPSEATDNQLERLEQRLDEMEKRHAQELKERDEEIVRLRRSDAGAAAGAGDAPATQPAPPTTGTAADDIEQTRQDVLRDLEENRSSPLPPAPGDPAPGGRAPVSFNPDIAVIADFVGSYSPDRDNDAYNRFDVREMELDIRAAVHPRADGVAVIAFERDVENPIFAHEEGGDEEHEGGPDTSVNLEEVYLFVHDFGVPNLTAKVGRFHVRFGRQNLLHLHDLPTTDPPFVNQAFLSPEALGDSGVSLSYVIPPRFVGGQYVEVIGEVLSGEGGPNSESPTLTGDLAVDSPAINVHALWNADLRRDVNIELGGSWLAGHRGEDNALDVNLFGLDATVLRTDPTGRFRNSVLQAEAMWAAVDQDDGSTQHAFGTYLLGQQQLGKDWYAGLRLDWTQDPNDDESEAWGVTPYVSWYWSDFLRFRASYQHRDGDREAEDSVWVQATWLFGAHPPHPYWSMR